jgi:hypothetical protein
MVQIAMREKMFAAASRPSAFPMACRPITLDHDDRMKLRAQGRASLGRCVGPVAKAAIVLLLGVLLTLPPPARAEEAEGSLSAIVYDYGVTSYCGLLTPELEAGFKRVLAEETARRGLDADAARAERIKGWVAADREWGNRGLGGFRSWCAEDGPPAVARFRAALEGGS